MGVTVDLQVESSLIANGLTVRLANYAFAGSEPIFRDMPDYYLTHLLTPQPTGLADIAAERSVAPEPVRSGMFHFMPAHWPIAYRPASSAGRVAQCVFEPQLFEDLAGSPGGWAAGDLQSYMDVRNPRIRDSMRRLEQEVALPSFGSLILVEALGRVITVEIARHFRSAPSDAKRVGQLHSWQVDRIADFVHASCGDGSTPSTTEIATLCNLSTGHLKRSFKTATGETLYRFIERVRIEKAQSLLRASDMPLKMVAAQSGFGSPSRLSEAFRRHVGETPSSYRQRVRTRRSRSN